MVLQVHTRVIQGNVLCSARSLLWFRGTRLSEVTCIVNLCILHYSDVNKVCLNFLVCKKALKTSGFAFQGINQFALAEQSCPYISLRIVLHLVAQLCPTLCDPMDCSPPGSSVHGILQARRLEWVAMPSSRGSSQPRDRTQVSRIAGGFFTVWATRGAQEYWSG